MNGFTTVQPSLSIETPTTANPLPSYFSANSLYHGISPLQPVHQVAQKIEQYHFAFVSGQFGGGTVRVLKFKIRCRTSQRYRATVLPWIARSIATFACAV